MTEQLLNALSGTDPAPLVGGLAKVIAISFVAAVVIIIFAVRYYTLRLK